MKVKMISVNNTLCFTSGLTDQLNDEVNAWLEQNRDIKLEKVTPSFDNVVEDGENIIVMTATIFYE